MRYARRFLVATLLLTLVAAAAKRRDPLTDAEADQLREAAMEPGKRVKLYIKFADARLVTIDQLRADAKAANGRGKQIHDLLEDFTAILDEINNNFDMYQGRPLDKDDKKDFRKGLKEFIEAADKFDLKLKTLHAAAQTDPQTRKESPDYQFALQDAEEALKSSSDMAREYMADKESKSPEPPKKK